MRALLLPAAAAFAVLGLSACGDPLVDGDYRGEPLYTLSGTVIADLAPEDYGWPEGELRISIDWAEWEGEEEHGAYDVEQLETITSFPAQFDIHIYHPPPEEAFFESPWIPGTQIAIGTPLLYIDEFANGSWAFEDEEVVGGSFDTVLVYAAQDSDVIEFDTQLGHFQTLNDGFWPDQFQLKQGYQLMFAYSELCDGELDSVSDFFPAYDAPVYLYVGDFWSGYFDWECDGDD